MSVDEARSSRVHRPQDVPLRSPPLSPVDAIGGGEYHDEALVVVASVVGVETLIIFRLVCDRSRRPSLRGMLRFVLWRRFSQHTARAPSASQSALPFRFSQRSPPAAAKMPPPQAPKRTGPRASMHRRVEAASAWRGSAGRGRRPTKSGTTARPTSTAGGPRRRRVRRGSAARSTTTASIGSVPAENVHSRAGPTDEKTAKKPTSIAAVRAPQSARLGSPATPTMTV